jgi:fructose-bisphosphate aldolase, class II
MTLTTSIPWLKRAQAEKFAMGAFNANTLEQMQAIVMGAQAEHGPVIIQISGNAAHYIGVGSRQKGLRVVAEMGRVIVEMVSVPVVLHLDHGHYADVLQALALGFTSVMYDGSDLPLDENIARTRELCQAAHEMNVCFEAELGEVPRVGVPGMETGELTDPAQVAEFAERTGVDALAIAIGSMHALKRKEVALDFARLDAIRAAVNTPLVLHGSSGVLDESVCEGIQRGLCKINVATQLSGVFTRTIRDYLAAHPDDVDPRKYLSHARAAMAEAVRERMRLYGVSGKAD